jgi:hypothetical protein
MTIINSAKSLFFGICILISSFAQGQDFNSPSPWEIGAGASAFIYLGDLTPNRLGAVETVKPGGLVFINYRLHPRWTLQAGAAIGSLKGDDAEYAKPTVRRERNFNFTSSMKEASLKLQYNLFDEFKAESTTLLPYVSSGIAVNFLNIKKDFSGLTSKLINDEPGILIGLQQDSIHGTPKRILTVPITVGLRKAFSQRWDVFTEANFRYSFSDYIDGFSKSVYGQANDHFYSVNVGLVYKFTNTRGLGCPRF